MAIPKHFGNDIPQVEKSEIVHHSFVKIRCDSLRLPNNHRYDYYTLITRAPAAVVLGITPEQHFVLIEEYRHPTGTVLLSCAGGYLHDDQEDPRDAARRELQEETGYSSDDIQLLGSAYPYPGISGQKIYYLVARNAIKRGDPQLEETEVVKPLTLSKHELEKRIASGSPIDGNLCTALYFLSRT